MCWGDKKPAGVKPLELLATPIAVDGEAVTCARCKKAAGLPSPIETAALKRAEAEAAPAKTARPKATRTRRQLSMEGDLKVRLKLKGIEVKGVLRPTGRCARRARPTTVPTQPLGP